ncbi:hypothetical protein HDU97_009535 [Phlyctochytrium planicorne]|nr:hypothetical protein HDU97_009535 [Phlyctochytrium planicorne]
MLRFITFALFALAVACQLAHALSPAVSKLLLGEAFCENNNIHQSINITECEINVDRILKGGDLVSFGGTFEECGIEANPNAGGSAPIKFDGDAFREFIDEILKACPAKGKAGFAQGGAIKAKIGSNGGGLLFRTKHVLKDSFNARRR